MTAIELQSLLFQALAEPHGIIVATSDPEKLRQKLYPIRKTDPAFTPLAFILSPLSPQHLWILKQGTAREIP
jgi:hypothetical protein